MINLREKIKSFLDENIKKKNSIAVSTTRLILAALKDRDIESRIKNKSGLIDDSEIFNMFQSMIKQRQESVKIYAEAGRHELKNRELSEIEIIESFNGIVFIDEAYIDYSNNSLISKVNMYQNLI